MRPGGEWDYKRRGDKFEEFGNFNFGATAAALGLPYGVSQRGAGLVNVGSAVLTMAERILRNFVANRPVPLPEWWAHGIPFLTYPFGDDYSDAAK